MPVACGSQAIHCTRQDGRKRHPKIALALIKNVNSHIKLESYNPNITSQLCDKRSDDGTVRLPTDNCWKPRERLVALTPLCYSAMLLYCFAAMVLFCFDAMLLFWYSAMLLCFYGRISGTLWMGYQISLMLVGYQILWRFLYFNSKELSEQEESPDIVF